MSFVNVPDVFIGSTDDGHTFVVLNRPIRGANRMLTGAGFTARRINDRTVYLLPPTTAEEVNERAGIAMYGLLAHTPDVVDLSWTTQGNPQDAQPEPSISFTLTSTSFSVTATTEVARLLLEHHGFARSADDTSYQPAMPLGMPHLLGAVVRTQAHARSYGITVHVELGIPTPDAIPAPSPRPSAAGPGRPGAGPAPRRSR
ncbi:hypothetical protein QR97_31965 [Streptomyces sp. PBH53]|uniref:hypothetical protein n=1 Tax=Streptomyces sp. PBH53 TaxID=1577075 RepID=UPI000655E0EB|nr:hypothetical protein [Streptomyces sp. PBH53]AKN73736.1 hypothetical protein QR97_31965 [Streptomyces sp. PBH53]